VNSPTYRGGLWDRTGAAILDPGKLAAGLRGAALRQGVRIYEHTAATELEPHAGTLVVITPQGRVRARSALLATSAFPPLLRSIRRYVVPVYDYALMTEPLDREQQASVGWQHRQGLGDMGNQFHYYRPTTDGRILFGGYDAIYRFRGPVTPRLDEHEATFGLLSVVWGCARQRAEAAPFAVGAYITAAYWFTSSTSFANPAVTVARSLTDTFSGIRPADAPGFVAAQLVGAAAATLLFRWLAPAPPRDADEVVMPRAE
jgi:glycine/D-amino acid oxidase-like deaminating enzyme